jgi:hypothetical protein
MSILFGTTTLAQGVCGELVTRALDKTSANCKNPIPNTVCYGNGLIFAQAQTGASLTFATDGDTAPIDAFAGITHSPLDEVAQLWGVSLMSLQANIPDTSPGQVVQIIVFGNVEVSDVQQSAFRFTTGVGTSTCTTAPANGIMVRTPEGVAEVTLTINEVDITMGSTAFMEANLTDGMTVTMLDGVARLKVANVTQPVSFSQQSNIPLGQFGQNLVPTAPPSPAQTWDAAKVSKVFTVYNTLNQLGTEAVAIGQAGPGRPNTTTQPSPTFIPIAQPTFMAQPTLTLAPCMIVATSSSVITRVGPGYNRGSFIYLTPNKPITVTGKKFVGDDLWWQLNKFEVSSSAASVIELWVAESDVIEQGDCGFVIDVDAPPIISAPPTSAPQPTAGSITRSTPTPSSSVIVPAVEPSIQIAVADNILFPGECTTVFVTIQFVTRAFFNGPGFVGDTSIEGPNWQTSICPPDNEGSYTYTLDATSLTGSPVQRFVEVHVVTS